jgi:hypothetical protein
MKYFVFIITFLNCCFGVFSQTESKLVCEYGFTTEISVQKNWGYAQPVVLSVTPNTSADAAGLLVNDIIEKINDKPTAGENIETITSWLQNSTTQIRLTISNFKGRNQIRTLEKNCRLNNSLAEKDLANIYSFYSLEDVQTRSFSCPFKTSVNQESNLLQYGSFGFGAPDPNNQALEKSINATIRKSLEQKGLKYSEKNPDLIVKTHYSYMANPNFRNNSNAGTFPVACRYNVNTQTMENLPIYYNPLIPTTQARIFLQLGIKLIDNKKKTNSSVWECETNELLQSEYPLAGYAEFHVPLMFMQYPYLKSADLAVFHYSRSKHNYTGIRYNMDNLKEVMEVDPSSPAAKAVIQLGDIIEKINDIKFESNTKTADNNYKQFIYKTLALRDPATQFTNAEGFTRCMYWNKMKYALICDEFKKPEYSAVFSYLFYFEPYINLSGTNIVKFSIIRGKEKEEIRVKPDIYSEVVFENQ